MARAQPMQAVIAPEQIAKTMSFQLTMPEIERLTGYTDWVDICKGWQVEG